MMTREQVIKALVDKFLAWPLPDSVCSDLCATKQDYPHRRSGTNLLTSVEAKQMIEHLFTEYDAALQQLEETRKVLDEVTLRRAESVAICDQLRTDLAAVREELRISKRISFEAKDGNLWYWADDEHDHLESLICPIVVRPELLRKWKQQLADLQAKLEQSDRLVVDGQEAIGHWQGEVNILMPKLAQVETERNTWRSRCEASRAANDACNRHIVDLQRQLAEAQGRIKELEDKS